MAQKFSISSLWNRILKALPKLSSTCITPTSSAIGVWPEVLTLCLMGRSQRSQLLQWFSKTMSIGCAATCMSGPFHANRMDYAWPPFQVRSTANEGSVCKLKSQWL